MLNFNLFRFFNNDPEVIDAIKNTPGMDTKDKGLFSKLIEEDLEDVEDIDIEEIKKKKENASEAVKKSLKLFEENIIHFSQNPSN